jgi:hypothetical protein
MRSNRTLRRVATAALLSVAFLLQGTWALAGVTGGITGVVHDDSGAPVAGATVIASSPSQTATATTDAGGHFQFLVLDPDTYTLTVKRDGYQTVSLAGNTVLADQTQSIIIVEPRALQVIAHARATAANLVKAGVGGDIYNVTPSQQEATASLGGGGNLNSAYSAISSVPGVFVPSGGAGWNQMTVIRGELPWTTGFEYDGVPVNRAFDQYNSSTESNLGLEELQVYTGGGPVSVSSNGISGFINQVIKTGTYPGYATFDAGIGTEAFYHQARLEVGGATPDRNFSYYVGISGYDQAFRNGDQQNGGDYATPGSVYDSYSALFSAFNTASGQGVLGLCNPNQGLFSGTAVPATSHAFDCFSYAGPYAGTGSFITDRENVVNLHIGVPRRDGQKDDIQLLWSDSAMQTFFYNSPIDNGPGVAQYTLNNTGNVYVPGVNYPYYMDSTVYNLPFGSQVNAGTGLAGTPYQYYYQPNSPTDRGFMAQIPSNHEDLYHNDVGVGKIAWTHPFSSNAFMRVYAYTMFTDWNEDGQASAYGYDFGTGSVVSPDYDLITHTAGGEIQFVDQLNDQNQVQLTANYVTATTSRWNNTGFIGPTYNDSFTGCNPAAGPGCGYFGAPWISNNNFSAAASEPIGLVADHGGTFTCYSIATMNPVPCYQGSSATGGFESNAYWNATVGEPAISGAAAAAGAKYINMWQGNASASWNQVSPQFYNVNLSEEWRPSDRLTVDVAGRYDNYNYILPNTNNVQNSFYAQIIQNYACVNPATDHPYLTPLAPGSFPPPSPKYVNGTCPTGYVHPNGVGSNPLFTDVSPSNYDMRFWSARVSATYQSDPNTVWRFSAGRYSEPPLTAAVQYYNSSGNNLSQWANFLGFGFLSPFHAIAGESSSQYDFSLEHHFAGSEFSMKLTPFYTYASNWEQQSFIGAGYVTQVPVGVYRSYGVEFALQDGDFAANGLSGEFTFTYTNATLKYQPLLGQDQVQQYNSAIGAYNCYIGSYYAANTAFCNKNYPNLASAGGAAPCYNVSTDTATSCTGATVAGNTCVTTPGNCVITNPYYNAAPQGYLDPNGWYPASQLAQPLYFGSANGIYATSYSSPYVANLILNWRMGKLAITPNLQYQAGVYYGSPMDVQGVDPLACGKNQGGTGTNTTNSPYNCDYTTAGVAGISPWGYLYIPNPQTGKFASLGQFQEPSVVTGNLQMTYDVSPRLRLMLTAASVFHACFGGTQEPWTTAFPTGPHTCGYAPNGSYVDAQGAPGSGYYVGASPSASTNGVTPLPWELQSYAPNALGNGASGYFPFNLYVQAQIHL